MTCSAYFAFQATPITAGETVTLQDSSTVTSTNITRARITWGNGWLYNYFNDGRNSKYERWYNGVLQDSGLCNPWIVGSAITSESYNTASTYTVTYQIWCGDGSTSTYSDTLQVNPSAATLPTPSFYANPRKVATGDSVTFYNTTYDPNNVVKQYEWSTHSDQSTVFTYNKSSITVTYSSSGSYDIDLYAWDAIGDSGNWSHTEYIDYITVISYSTPYVYFSTDLPFPQRNSLITFTDESSTTFNPIKWTWTFSDGYQREFINDPTYDTWSIIQYQDGVQTSSQTGSGQIQPGYNFTHKFTTIGDHWCKLTVYDYRNNTSTYTKNINVRSIIPNIIISYAPSSPYIGDTVSFSNNSSNTTDVTKWQWDFGDGVTYTGFNASHVYTSSATYSVKLVATVTDGRQYSTTTNVAVQQLPMVERTIYLNANIDTIVLERYPNARGYGALYDGLPCGIDDQNYSVYYLVKFDISNIPSDAEIVSASMRFYVDGVHNNPMTLVAYTASAGWDETVTWNNKPGTQTYIGSKSLAVSGAETSVSFDVKSVVKSTNAGFILLCSETTGPRYTNIYSSKYVDGAKVPLLVVTYKTQTYCANFYANKTSGYTPLTVQFTDISYFDGGATWLWNFGDGATSTAQNPSHTYTLPSNSEFELYTVTLTVTANTTLSKTKTDYIAVRRPASPPAPGETIVPDFDANATSGIAPQTVTFVDQSSPSPTSWRWSFGDCAYSTSQSPTHTYSSPGVYTVSLYVQNDTSTAILSKTNYITITAPVSPPIANFVVESVQNNIVKFNNTSSGDITTVLWDFGDGSTSTMYSPSHTYAPGTYSVTLTVNGGASSKTISDCVTITSSLYVNFTADVVSGSEPLTVTFTDKSSGATSWSWSFGDGTTSTLQNPSHIYNRGVYNVMLTVNNDASLTKTGFIHVMTTRPTPSFTVSMTDNIATFTNNSTNADTYTWYFGDGGWSSLANPSHIYSDPGRYVIELVARRENRQASTYHVIDI